jgi:hypothetical protein
LRWAFCRAQSAYAVENILQSNGVDPAICRNFKARGASAPSPSRPEAEVGSPPRALRRLPKPCEGIRTPGRQKGDRAVESIERLVRVACAHLCLGEPADLGHRTEFISRRYLSASDRSAGASLMNSSHIRRPAPSIENVSGIG